MFINFDAHFGVLLTVEISGVKSMGFWDCYKYVAFFFFFFLLWVTKVISNVFMF